MKAEDVHRLGEELGLDAVGVTRAEAYAATERHIVERRERGLFGGMKFTMAHPEQSCHPETLLPDARSVVSAARCYWRPEAPLASGEGRLARYTWDDAYAELRDTLDLLGRRLGGAYRVLVDANQHVDREAAARAGIGFYGKNTMLITRRHGSWVVLGTLVTDVELEPTPPLEADCGACTLCIDACPTGALDHPGTLDATRCLSYWTQAPAPIPEAYRAALGTQVYGCDICQDVCPWNRGVQKRRDEAPEVGGHIDLVAWLEADGQELVGSLDRLYVPKNDPRWLRRNAAVVLGNTGGAAHVPALERAAAGGDTLVAEHARWALGRIADRAGAE
jgi:epoxyqueuosine reductase